MMIYLTIAILTFMVFVVGQKLMAKKKLLFFMIQEQYATYIFQCFSFSTCIADYFFTFMRNLSIF